MKPRRGSIVAVNTKRDIIYRTIGGISLHMDVYWPKIGGPYPILMAVHGGGWWSGDEDGWAQVAPLYADAGWAVFAPEYRLAPPGGPAHYPDATEDVDAAVAWAKAHAGTYRADASRVAILGSSAGGHLAAYQAMAGNASVQAAASWSGPQALYEMQSAGGDGFATCERFIGCALDVCPESWQAASPRDAVASGKPAVYLANSDAEIIPLAQATTMADALTTAGVPNQLRVLSGTLHGVQYESQVRVETLAFLRAHLAG